MENVNRDEEEVRHLVCLYMLQYFRENGYTWCADELVRLANIDESELNVLDPPTLRELIEQETRKKDTSLGNASTIAQTQTTTNNPTVDQLRKIIDGMHLSPRPSIDQEDNAYAMDLGLEKSPPPHSASQLDTAME